MSVINHLLAQSLNYLPWVIVGLVAWVVAYWQLYTMKEDTFADVVTLILSVLPLGIAFVSANVAIARWHGKTRPEAVVFSVLAVISLGYFAFLYITKTKVRQVLNDRGILSKGTKAQKARLIIQVLVGAISLLASITLLIGGGWELIQGSATIGLILALVGGVMLALDRGPQRKYKNWRINVFELTYSALTEGSVSSPSDVAGVHSAAGN